MQTLSRGKLDALRALYPKGTRVELVQMDDPYNKDLQPGCKGTVDHIDSIGTIHVSWDCCSSLGVVFGKDLCRKITGEVGLARSAVEICTRQKAALQIMFFATVKSTAEFGAVRKAGLSLVSDALTAVLCTATSTIGDAM